MNKIFSGKEALVKKNWWKKSFCGKIIFGKKGSYGGKRSIGGKDCFGGNKFIRERSYSRIGRSYYKTSRTIGKPDQLGEQYTVILIEHREVRKGIL